MARLYALALIILVCGTAMPASAEPEKESEIRHLLAFVADSGCTFIRNNNEYPSEEAKSHIEMKYKYLKSKISTAEEFIKYVATKSSLSGKNYKIRCNGESRSSSQWLLEELAAYRNDQAGEK